MEIVCKVPLGSSYAEGAGERILVYAEAWGRGGIESFLMNLFRRLQNNGFNFALFTTWDWNDELDEELSRLGVGRWTRFSGKKPSQIKRLREGPIAYGSLIEQIGCDAAYVNTMNGMGFLWADMARKHGVPLRVVHSHNSAFGMSASGMKSVAHRFGKIMYGRSATKRVACSDGAGRYLFGKHPFEVVNNGVDTNRFAFDSKTRAIVRSHYQIPDDAHLFGSIGRIEEAKNPLFQVMAFSEIHKVDPSARYLMVGEGDMREKVESLVEMLNLEDAVLMPGYLTDPAPLYSALDCFLMPSLYEGVPLASIECQCSGCPILAVDGMAKETQVTDLESMLSLDMGEKAWAEEAIRLTSRHLDRAVYARQVEQSGFSADETAKRMAAILSADEVTHA